MPAIYILRNLLLSQVVSVWAEHGIWQVLAMASLQSVYLGLLIKARPYVTIYDNCREILDQVLITCCMWLKLISFTRMDSQYRQTTIGGTIAIMIILILLNGILFVLLSFGKTVYVFC